jgi:hypothetical protein
VKSGLTVIGVSVTSAAFTTFVAGAVMCFSETLFFFKFGVFMTLVMSMSWLFSTYFLMAMLGAAGPTGKWGHICCGYEGRKKGGEEDDEIAGMILSTKVDQAERMAAKFKDVERSSEVDPSKFKSAKGGGGMYG